MSKQYLTTHTIDDAHVTDIFSLSATPTSLISASGASSIKIHSTIDPEFPLLQTIPAHKLGCHHITSSFTGKTLASSGFEGTIKIYRISEETSNFTFQTEIPYNRKIGEVWALALDDNGQFLAGTTHDGKIIVWDIGNNEAKVVQEYETKGSFGLCVALSRDGQFTASGHVNGGVYIFNNNSGRMVHALPSLSKPVRTVAFSPKATRLAAAGDSMTVAIFDTLHGEQVANLTGHSAWVFSVDWNDTGEYLLSGSFDGKSKVWNIVTSQCVATHAETDKTIWCVKWLPKTGKNEGFAVTGANRSITFYREATGG